MENFAILTDAGGDFTRETIQKYGIEETLKNKEYINELRSKY